MSLQNKHRRKGSYGKDDTGALRDYRLDYEEVLPHWKARRKTKTPAMAYPAADHPGRDRGSLRRSLRRQAARARAGVVATIGKRR